MKLHLVTATVLGMAAMGFAASPGFAMTNTTGNGVGSNSVGTGYNPNFGSSGNGASQDTGLRSHESGQQANGTGTFNNNFGSSGNGASRNTGLGPHESGTQAMNGSGGNNAGSSSTNSATGSSGMGGSGSTTR